MDDGNVSCSVSRARSPFPSSLAATVASCSLVRCRQRRYRAAKAVTTTNGHTLPQSCAWRRSPWLPDDRTTSRVLLVHEQLRARVAAPLVGPLPDPVPAQPAPRDDNAQPGHGASRRKQFFPGTTNAEPIARDPHRLSLVAGTWPPTSPSSSPASPISTRTPRNARGGSASLRAPAPCSHRPDNSTTVRPHTGGG